jgi:DNA-binding transcriptional ArsR family regulator
MEQLIKLLREKRMSVAELVQKTGLAQREVSVKLVYIRMGHGIKLTEYLSIEGITRKIEKEGV